MFSLARFKWDIESFKPDFSISPTKGYISPGMDVPFVVTFRPSKLSRAIQYEGLRCSIQDGQPLQLTLTGCCMETPVTKEVRGAETGWVPLPPPFTSRLSQGGDQRTFMHRHALLRPSPQSHPSIAPAAPLFLPLGAGEGRVFSTRSGRGTCSRLLGHRGQRGGLLPLRGIAGGGSWEVVALAAKSKPGAALAPAHEGAVWLQLFSSSPCAGEFPARTPRFLSPLLGRQQTASPSVPNLSLSLP